MAFVEMDFASGGSKINPQTILKIGTNDTLANKTISTVKGKHYIIIFNDVMSSVTYSFTNATVLQYETTSATEWGGSTIVYGHIFIIEANSNSIVATINGGGFNRGWASTIIQLD